MTPRSHLPWVVAVAIAAACTGDPPPALPPSSRCATGECVARSPISAITRAEYGFAVEDVLGVTGVALTALPADGSFDAFPGNSNAPRGADAAAAYESVANEVALVAVPELATRCAQQSCIEALVRDLGSRLHRHPIADEDLADYVGLYVTVRSGETHEAALGAVVSALLQSPRFLYRVEIGTGNAVLRPLSDAELAGRLASFLWRSVPDALLLDAVTTGTLSTDEGLDREVARMIADPRFDRALVAFDDGWLGTAHAPTTAGLAPEIVADMREELARYTRGILRSDRPTLAHLLTEPNVPLSVRLAEHYGVDVPATDWDLVAMPERAGLLARGMTVVSNSGTSETRSIHRGLMVHRRVLCRLVGGPTPEAAVRTRTFVRDPQWSDREYVTHLTLDDASCRGCHGQFGPLGFAFEGLDVAARTVPDVDARGTLDGASFDGVPELEALLANGEVEDCVMQRWLAFALGRAASDDEVLSIAYHAPDLRTGSGELDLARWIARIPHTDAFRTARAP